MTSSNTTSAKTFEKNIDNNSVQKHVKNSLKNLSLTAESIEVVPGTSHGDNYMGLIAKVRVLTRDLEGNRKVCNWIVKSAQRNKKFRESAKTVFAYQNEIYMYMNVFPAFEKLQIDLLVHPLFKPYPQFHYHCLEYMNETIILENLNEMGYSLADRKKPMEFEYVHLVIQTYAKYHALSYVLKDQTPKTFEDLKRQSAGHYFNEATDQEIEEFMETTKKAVMSCFDSEKEKVMVDVVNNFFENCPKMLKAACTTDEYSAFTHGDCWTNNMLFKKSDDGNPDGPPTDVRFIDFQISSLCSPVLDISYFLSANTSGSFREKHFNFLLNEYYSCLVSFIKRLGSDPDKLYPKEVYHKHLKEFMFYGLYLSMIVVKLMLVDVEEAPDFSLAESQEEMANMFNFEAKSQDDYKKRIKDLVKDFHNYGFI